ncbi:MAG: biosynthetic arginine decarboxylase [Phycisphaerales bacterium]
MTTISPSESKSRLLRGPWTPEDSSLLYGIPDWSNGYFRVSDAGTLLVTPDKSAAHSIDLHELVEGLCERGVTTPILLRFPGILADRMQALHGAFTKAIGDHDYAGGYSCVYPIKVNQQKQVVESVRDIGSTLGFGLEAGSKPELLAVLGMTAGFNDMPIVCNGFKDDEFIETVVLATKLGRNIIPVVEKFSELELLVKHAERYGVRPKIGVRVKISARGAGRWEGSAGVRSKFGLFISEVIEALEYLKARGMEDCLRMLHFHIGSQVCDIRRLKHAITELAYIYTELRRLGAGMDTIDIGGGLAVDYDGSKSAFDSSMNYSIEEYAADVIYRIKTVCDDAGAPHPTIISESGRAMVAYMSVLVFDVLGVSRFDASPMTKAEVQTMLDSEEETPQPVLDLLAARDELTDRNLVQTFHDAMQARDELMSLFSLGYVSLPLRAAGERLFWETGAQILERARKLKEMPEDLSALPEILSDIYFCNLSIFQSLPDSWAIDQVFPIMPIHRLDEQPTRLGILADITCDSDGKIDNFASRREAKKTLELHSLKKGEPYYLAATMVGAYQEILGDLHNLLGDTNAAHITFGDDGEVVIDEVIRGDSVADTLSYMQVDHKDLRRTMRADAEKAVRRGVLTVPESRSLLSFYEAGLDGYTYLEEGD